MKTQELINVLTRLNFYSRINHVPSKLKNTFKVLILALLLTSCGKLEEIVPQHSNDQTTQVHIYYNDSDVSVMINGINYYVPRRSQGVKVINVNNLESIIAFNYGNKATLTIYKSNERITYSNFNYIYYAPKGL